MIPLDARAIAAATSGDLRGDGARVARTVATDSRQIEGDALFVALRGENADGHDYIDEAVANGAVIVLSERPVEVATATVVVVDDTWQGIGQVAAAVRDRVDPRAVAITGSVGKTTTKDLTAAAVGAGRPTVAAQGSFNNELGVPLTLLALEADSEVVVSEVGARGVGHIAELMPLVRPDIGIVTAVAGVHLELFGDIDAIETAKGELVEALPAGGTAILNGNDERVSRMATRTDAAVLRYGTPDEAVATIDFAATEVTLDRVARPTFTARTPWGEVRTTLPVAGRHQVMNALAALAAAGTLGVDLEAAAGALRDAPVSEWRGEVIEAGGVIVLNDAYNANPTSVRAAVDMLQSVERTGSTWAVLGVMAEIGDTHERDHRDTGREAVERGVDHLIVVGEDAAAMAEGGRAAGGDDVRRVSDADEALSLVRDEVEDGDVVLVKASRVGGLEAVAQGLAEHRGGTGS
ncbi:MAG: UDP-N-acetylmuramoyl-tripeptide--D-alanyl-D-alanine ligase [Nitriliruptorales bacterium]|nr:UDP-N-acetylmuramoyl-tripeptide--D-alanyl-D-alanine ligase [Nitriliruptorales bacterium]